jgi:ATP-dependent DNA ligase
VILYAFDLLELDGLDLRALTLAERKERLAVLLRRAPAGIHLVEHDAGDGEKIFQAACSMGLEGIVSKRLDMPYRAGPSKMWLKIKNPKSPAMLRLDDENWNWR